MLWRNTAIGPSSSDLFSLEGSPGSAGGSGGGGSLDGLVGHDSRGKLLLGFLEAGAGGAVQPMDLRGAGVTHGTTAPSSARPAPASKLN